MKNSMELTRDFLESIEMPRGDAYDLPTSEERFQDGGQFRFEVPGIQGPKVMRALLEELDRLKIYIHRVTQTKGIMFLHDNEIVEMVQLAGEWKVELILAVGPRATTDTSASVNTPEGVRMGYRLRGQEQIIRAVEDVKRASRLGVKSFLLYDEGCLWLLNEMRSKEIIPKDCHFKLSAHMGYGNPCAAKVAEIHGANSVNPVRDIQLQMLAAMRQAISIPIDIHTENPKSTGGFIRHYEVPEMIRVAAPLYLKTGGSVAQTHSWDSTIDDARKRAKQVSLVYRMIREYYPEALISPKGSFK